MFITIRIYCKSALVHSITSCNHFNIQFCRCTYLIRVIVFIAWVMCRCRVERNRVVCIWRNSVCLIPYTLVNIMDTINSQEICSTMANSIQLAVDLTPVMNNLYFAIIQTTGTYTIGVISVETRLTWVLKPSVHHRSMRTRLLNGRDPRHPIRIHRRILCFRRLSAGAVVRTENAGLRIPVSHLERRCPSAILGIPIISLHVGNYRMSRGTALGPSAGLVSSTFRNRRYVCTPQLGGHQGQDYCNQGQNT